MSNILVNETIFDAAAAPAHESLLGFLRDTARLTGTKEGCASGDCGACTVILREPDGSAAINVNSCITPVGAAIDKQVITVEGVGTPENMHPVQQAMVTEHGSQCGFCTPGFVMSLVAAELRANPGDKQREHAVQAISGNLCRCTGYRPIIDAALHANAGANNKSGTLPGSWRDLNPERQVPSTTESKTYSRPRTLDALFTLMRNDGSTRSLLADDRRNARWLVAGTTDAFLEVSQRYLDPSLIADVSDVVELQGITVGDDEVTLGAAVTHAEALAYFASPDSHAPAIVAVLERFGSPQIRFRGTLGGNIANASPIADWPPMLIALDAELTLADAEGTRRRLPLDEFYLDYKRTVLGDSEMIVSVHIPKHIDPGKLQAHKISKRFEDDISSVLAAVYLRVSQATIGECRIAFGGVAATPLRCVKTEAALLQQTLNSATIETAVAQLGHEITPISDVRASDDYRKRVAQSVFRNLLLKQMTDRAGASS